MSELNVYHHELRPNEYAEFYLKYEADEVIADLEESHKMEVEQLLIEIVKLKQKNDDSRYTIAVLRKENSHQKLKRCLAMARWCMTEYIQSKCLDFTNTEQWYWRRWHIRWRNLAEKFKEAK